MTASDRSPTAEGDSGLRFKLPARAENVAVVRHAVGGLAETLGMDPIAVSDLKTIVSEACTNAVVHAYGDGEGPLEVEVSPDVEGMTVTVRDTGSGIRPRPDLDQSRLRLGLPLIAALSSSFSISGGVGRGTEVSMRMQMTSDKDVQTVDVRADDDAPMPDSVPGTTITASDERIVGPVLGRVLAVLAARTNFPVDRLTDTMLLADALAARAAEGFDDGVVRLMVEDGDGTIDLQLGPMREGAAEELRRSLRIPGIGATLEKLADEVDVASDDDGEYLHMKMRPVRS